MDVFFTVCRTKLDRRGNRIIETVPLIGVEFLVLCDVLMHRSPFFSKAYYEKMVLLDDRLAFLDMSRADHSAPEAREVLAECWCNHVRFRTTKGMKMAYGMRIHDTPTTNADGSPCVTGQARIAMFKGVNVLVGDAVPADAAAAAASGNVAISADAAGSGAAAAAASGGGGAPAASAGHGGDGAGGGAAASAGGGVGAPASQPV